MKQAMIGNALHAAAMSIASMGGKIANEEDTIRIDGMRETFENLTPILRARKDTVQRSRSPGLAIHREIQRKEEARRKRARAGRYAGKAYGFPAA